LNSNGNYHGLILLSLFIKDKMIIFAENLENNEIKFSQW